MNFISKARSLSLGDYYMLLWANIMLPVTGLRLRTQGFKKAYGWANGGSSMPPQKTGDSLNRPIQLGKLINFAALHGLYHAKCLCRSLVLLKVLRKEGFAGELKVGVSSESGGKPPSILDAHAWVECDGVVVNDHANVAANHAVFHLTGLLDDASK